MHCFCCFFSLFLSEVHTKKVRKVPPGLPSSVSDKMHFFFYIIIIIISETLPPFRMCVAKEKTAEAPGCFLSWFCSKIVKRLMWKSCQILWICWGGNGAAVWGELDGNSCWLFAVVPLFGSQEKNIYCFKSTGMYPDKCCSFFFLWVTVQSLWNLTKIEKHIL